MWLCKPKKTRRTCISLSQWYIPDNPNRSSDEDFGRHEDAGDFPNAPFGGEIVTVTSAPVNDTGASILFAKNARGEEEPFLSEELTFV